jgi:hypothetical protein
VKFIRFAEWRIEQTGQGVVAFITNHAYLDNPTFRGMRAHLLRTFQRLYIVNLHGNARRKERAPDGSPDENLFDIQQGAILIAIRKPNKFPSAVGKANTLDESANIGDESQNTLDESENIDAGLANTLDESANIGDESQNTLDESENIDDGDDNAPVWYCDVWGSRDAKYDLLRTATLESIRWAPLTPRAPMYLFVPQDTALEAEYQRGWRIPDIFPVHSVGIVTARDGLTIHRTPDAVWQTVCELVALEPEAARERFRLGKDVRDWSVARAQQDLREAGVPNESAKACIVPILYRPFDVRYTFYTGRSRGFHCMPRPEVMRHLLAGENVALVVGRAGAATGDEEWNIVFVAQQPVDLNIFRRGGGEVYPLYLLPDTAGAQKALLPHEGRKENLSAAFLEALAGVLGHEPAPESVLGYLYAVLHSPTYRARYAEFLKRDFPRVPLPPDKATFDALAQLGGALIDLHLLRDPALQTPSCKYPVGGDHRVERVAYDPSAQRVWINGAQYFEPVSPEVWAYRVGGYQVCHKWLDDRKGATAGVALTHTNRRARVHKFLRVQNPPTPCPLKGVGFFSGHPPIPKRKSHRPMGYNPHHEHTSDGSTQTTATILPHHPHQPPTPHPTPSQNPRTLERRHPPHRHLRTNHRRHLRRVAAPTIPKHSPTTPPRVLQRRCPQSRHPTP